MDIAQAKKIMKNNFIGPGELDKIGLKFNLIPTVSYGKVPIIKFNESKLKKLAKDYILILGIPTSVKRRKLTLNYMRELLGVNPEEKEPCFYNQDWYLKEKFAAATSLKFNWYLIRKSVKQNTRGKSVRDMKNLLNSEEKFPSAVLAAYTFFAWYFLYGEFLWDNDFIWCNDKDHNGDRIYVGRYIDPNKMNKNGFNIHRHLSVRKFYGLAPEIKI